MLSDLKYTFRQLRKSPSFVATVLATFAVCIGTNALIFSVVHAVLLKPLPFPDPDRLVITINSYPKAGVLRIGSSAPNYFERKSGIPAFTEVAALKANDVIIGDAGNPERVSSFRVTPSFFRVLGVSPARGRLFREEEGLAGRDGVVILSDGFWRKHYNADPAAVGRTLQINGSPSTVIGVLPAQFNYLGIDARLWQPMVFANYQRVPADRHDNSIGVIARLKPGFSLAEAQAEVDSLNRRMGKEDPFDKIVSEAGFHTDVLGLHANYVSDIRPALLLLQAGVLFLLLIGFVNLVNLFMIRANARARDQAVRQVLGASRRRLAVQTLGETMSLALAGGGLGVAIAAAGLRLLTAMGTRRLPLGADIALDSPVIIAALAGSAAVGVLLALPVIVASFRRDLAPALSAESRSGTTTRASHRIRHSLIVAQIALAFVLLSGAGLLGLSFQRVLSQAPGFRTENVLTGTVELSTKNYGDYAKRFAFSERLLDAMRSLPGTTSAALSTALPSTGGTSISATWVEGYASSSASPLRGHYVYHVAGNYFETMGLTLRAGRFLTPADTRRTDRVCVVDTDFSRRYWPGKSAIGHRISFGPPNQNAPTYFSIVGVVGTVKQTDLTDVHEMGVIYLPFFADKFSQNNSPSAFFAILRTSQNPDAAVAGLRQAVLSTDPQLPLDNIETMTNRVDDSLATRRSTMSLAGTFAAMALLLAAVGVYGVLAFAVNQRQREIGVRMALGALPEQIMAKFLWLGCRLLLIGIVIGLIGAWWAGRAMGSLLFGVSPFNPAVIAGTAAVLGAVVLLASFLPSRRAARLSPLEALRTD